MAEQWKAAHGDGVAVMHQEVYEGNDPTIPLRKPLTDFKLKAEPCLFMLDLRRTLRRPPHPLRGRRPTMTAPRTPRPAARRGRRLGAALGLAGLALLAGAPSASAHGFFLTPALPIPVWLFAVVAGLVVVGSFAAITVMWSEPKLAERHWQPTRLGLGIASRAGLEFACGAIGVLILVLVIYSGLGAQDVPQAGDRSFATVWVFVIFWAGVPLAQLLLGDVFAAFNPWRAIGRLVAGLGVAYIRPPAGVEPRPLLRYPRWLGYFPAVVGLLAFAYLELCSSRSPEPVGQAALVYTVVTLAAMALFGPRTWLERGEAFSVYFGLYARISPFEVRDGRLGLRRPLSALADLSPPTPGAVALLAVMIGSVSYDGAGGTPDWQRALGWITARLADLGFSPIAAQQWGNFVGVLLFSAAAFGFYCLGILGMRTVGGSRSVRELAQAFAPSLVPIALAYLLAHNLTQLLVGGQSVFFAISDPLVNGSDLFGTASFEPRTGFSPEVFWYLEVGAIVLGHIAGVILAHDIALRVFDRARQAALSQLFMLTVMVGFTVLALWLLKQASEL